MIGFGKPVIAGTGISTAIIASRFNARESIAELAAEYDCPPQKIEEAIRWERHFPPQLEEFVLYLDENLCNSIAIQETLRRLEIRFERHLSHFSRGALDEAWLPSVGKNGWILLTTDKRMRYNLLERRARAKSCARVCFRFGKSVGR